MLVVAIQNPLNTSVVESVWSLCLSRDYCVALPHDTTGLSAD